MYRALWSRVCLLILSTFLVFSCGRGTSKPDGSQKEVVTQQETVQEPTSSQEPSQEPSQETVAEASQEAPSDSTSVDAAPEKPADSGPMDSGSQEPLADKPPVEGPPTEPGPAGQPDQSCGGSLPPAPSGKLCTVKAGNSTTIIIANVLTPDKWIAQGQVTIDDKGKITCVGCNCLAQAQGATVLTCPKGYLTPGLINAHEHLGWATKPPRKPGSKERYEHRHHWRKGSGGHTKLSSGGSDNSGDAIAWAEVRMLMSGATSIAGSGHAPNLIRNLDRSGHRGGVPGSLRYDTFPLGDSSGKMSDTNCTSFSGIRKSSSITEDAYIPHIAEGINKAARNEFNCTSRSDQGGQPLVTQKTGIIHGVGLLPVDIRKMAAVGASLIWSPRSNIDLYGNTATVPLFLQLGVTVALGTDWPISGSMNMSREIACADYLNQNHFDGKMTNRQIVQMVTSGAAKATGVLKHLGTIEVGKFADLTLFDGTNNPGYRSVIDAKPQDIALVMIGGKTKYGNEALIDDLLGQKSQSCELLIACAQSKKICIKDDFQSSSYKTVKDYASLYAKWNSSYPLFFCQTPKDEPSCVPFRDDKYGKYGHSRQNDKDGDGIEDTKDNCPNVFNPIRPMDEGKQADHDKDGKGDVCDVCPFDANTTTCKKFDPNDRDSDGKKNSEDNCPDVANPKQEDKDKDGIGDACDDCPTPNKPGESCPTSIYDIKTDKNKLGKKVLLKNVLVTAIDAPREKIVVQIKETDKGYKGADHSGIFVYLGRAGQTLPKFQVGQRVDIAGTPQNYFDQIQVSSVTKLTVVTATPETLPKPVSVSIKDINSKTSTRAKALEGVVVEIKNVEVTNRNPDDPKDFGEFEVAASSTSTDKIRVEDTFDVAHYVGSSSCAWSGTAGTDTDCYTPFKCQCPKAPCAKGNNGRCYEAGKQPLPDLRKVGDKFTTVRGPLLFSFGNFKINPRGTKDLVK